MPAGTGQSGRIKLLLFVTVVLAALVVVTRLELVSVGDMPWPSAIEAQEDELVKLTKRLAALQEKQNEARQEREELQRVAEPFWRPGVRAASSEVQSEYEKLGRRARVTIGTIGNPREEKVSDQVRSVEFAVRITGAMRDVSRLLVEMENAHPPFYWTGCMIRPDNARDPKGISLTGKIQALVLTDEATEIIEGGDSGT